MKNLIIFIVLLFCFCIQSFAQNTSTCPKISVSASSDFVQIGEPLTFTAKVEGMSLEKIGYLWTISTEEIFDGQGTSVIKVNSKTGNSITATIELTVLPANCVKSASLSLVVVCILPRARNVAEISSASSRTFEENLDKFFSELNNDPTAKGYILERFKKNSSRSLIEQRIANISKAITSKKFLTGRIDFFVA